MGVTFIVILLGYTGILLGLTQRSKRHARTAGQFLDGGRRFGTMHVFILMTAMWGASMFSVEIDTGYLQGISAMWYGISIILSSLLIATCLLTPFRKIGYLTNSNLIGKRYGKFAKEISALVIGLTFPIFAMKNVLAAASFLHVILGWSLPMVLILTTAIVVLYVSFGGLWSLAYVQVANLCIFFAALLVAAYFGILHHHVLHTPIQHEMHFTSLTGIGMPTILVWFGMNVLNAVSAQAEFQTISAAKEVKSGRRGVYWSSIILVFFAIIPVLLGMAAREHMHLGKSGLLAFPAYLQTVAPHWAIIFVGIGFWSAALIWCAPLLFSGASSLGLDLFNRNGISHENTKIRRFTRLSMLLQGIFIVLYALARPGELAWWAVFGLTIRNAAIVAPTISYFIWPMVRQRTIVMSMLIGVLSGFLWNAATGFSATQFPFGINPMWVGTGLSMLVVMIGTVIENWGEIQFTKVPVQKLRGILFLSGGFTSLLLSMVCILSGFVSLIGPDLFVLIVCMFFSFTQFLSRSEHVLEVEQTPVVNF